MQLATAILEYTGRTGLSIIEKAIGNIIGIAFININYIELLSILCKLDLADETARNTQLMTTCHSLHQQPTRLGSSDHSILEDLRL